MPYIKKIELEGFKSFGPKRVKVTLDKGFTAITGPNGSGKTNIIDAVLFCLGELSTKRLRAEGAAKLIFHGSDKAGLGKAGRAKAVIQFNNGDRRIPVDTATVTISREVRSNGQSVYRMNGRRTSRSHILEVLSIAGISSASRNIIMQGTITRLTDISFLERRKIVEDLVGIAQYDAEKADADEKLRTADISIRTAMGRIDEVQGRVDALERERNDLLRYSFIENEIQKLEAVKLSQDIAEVRSRTREISLQAEKVKASVEELRDLRERLRSDRRGIEGEWRRLSSETVEEGGQQVLRVQIKIGDLKSRITELTTKISSGKASLEGLQRVEENNLEQYQSIREKIHQNRLEIRRLRRRHGQTSKEVSESQTEHDELAEAATQLWDKIGENSRRVHEIEKKLDHDYEQLTHLKSEDARSREAIKIRKTRLRSLMTQKERLDATLGELEGSLDELKKVHKEQKTQLRNLQRILERRIIQRKAAEAEIREAGLIAGSAREAVIEFTTQRELAATVASEEKALRSMEEMGDLGVIPGIYGRLRNLIKVDRTFRKAVEAAAAGWLDSLIVKDLDSAFACTETLRRLELGRIKIIPAEGVLAKSLEPPKKPGISGPATFFVTCKKPHEPAVSFVFGDTLIVKNDEAALALSNEGYRAVTVNGDVYEPGGALESGFYRAPIDLSTIIPSEAAIKRLDEAVGALRDHLSQRNSEIAAFEEDIERTQTEIMHLSETTATLHTEIARIKRNTARSRTNMKRLDNRVARLQRQVEDETRKIWTRRAERSSIRKRMQRNQKELASLRKKADPIHIQEKEIQREKLAEKIIALRQKLGSIDTDISTLQSEFSNVLRVGYKNAKVQLAKVTQQLRKVRLEVEDALDQRESLNRELTELERSRVELSHTVLTARQESKKFTAQIDNIDAQLQKLDSDYEPAERLHNQLQLKIQTFSLQLEQHQKQLRLLGYEQPLNVTTEQVEEAETSIKMMQLELDRIGAVNQLALSHYAEQISRYKDLSLRLNELEKEKKAIIDFMEEIERKKRQVFMEAFQQINDDLRSYFSKLTGGGSATLKLENVDDPFSGGIDMIVQFPNKPSIVVSGASGGERSVAAVAFIFALKEFTPATFYILDEIDAHLDAFHVSKLAELLMEEAARTQFLVITLKPEMLNKAQKVYGVYGLNGVSNVISAKLLEVRS